MIDLKILALFTSSWFVVWHVVYALLPRQVNTWTILTISMHFLLMWVFFSLMFYWVFLRSAVLFFLIALAAILQIGWAISQLAKEESQKQ
jgi:hypothetical protein